MELLTLFWVFAKIGAVTFGGGLAMLPILQREIVDKRSWADEEELLDYYAIGQCTPGVIAVNTATFIQTKRHIGRNRRNTWGNIPLACDYYRNRGIFAELFGIPLCDLCI